MIQLAEALFAIPHVSNVFYVDHWLTVTQDGKAHWPDLLRQLAVPIRDAPSAQERSERADQRERGRRRWRASRASAR